MDFFEAFPDLQQEEDPSLKGRSLRLITLSGLACDNSAYYFEISQERYWTRGPEGHPVMGLGGIQIKLETRKPPLKVLSRHVRDTWLTEPEFLPTGYITLLEGERCAVLSGDPPRYQAMPHLLLLTPPRLGGAEVPDALVQAIYIFELKKPPFPSQSPGIVKIARDALGAFFESESWSLAQLSEQPWASLITPDPLPGEASLRPVLALRGLQILWRKGTLSKELSSCLQIG